MKALFFAPFFIFVAVTLAFAPDSQARRKKVKQEPIEMNRCPKSNLGETDRDCPYATMARTMENFKTKANLKTYLQTAAPEILEQVQADVKSGALDHWATSRNADASDLTKSIVNPLLVETLADAFGKTLEDPKVFSAPAGILHTYGYLFSLVRTPYGYKRARYVDGEMDRGFDLPEGSLSGKPKSGTLLSNLTNLAKKYAYTTTPVAGAVRVIEKSDDNTIELHTDLVPFTKPAGLNNYGILIYTIKHDATRITSDTPLKIITVFPISESSFKQYTPASNEEHSTVQLKYNGSLLPASTATSWSGSKRVIK